MYNVVSKQFGYSIYVEWGGSITDQKKDAFVTDDIKIAEHQAVMFSQKAGYKFSAEVA